MDIDTDSLAFRLALAQVDCEEAYTAMVATFQNHPSDHLPSYYVTHPERRQAERRFHAAFQEQHMLESLEREGNGLHP